jgi:hypothetical protein
MTRIRKRPATKRELLQVAWTKRPSAKAEGFEDNH